MELPPDRIGDISGVRRDVVLAHAEGHD